MQHEGFRGDVELPLSPDAREGEKVFCCLAFRESQHPPSLLGAGEE